MADLTPSPGFSWFDDGRLGLFIHWGAYAVAARHEWVMERERIPVEAYEMYADEFTADLYDPDEWTARAVEMGARYIVITTKHHDGFALWDSAISEYTASKAGAGRDLIRPLLDSARAAGLRVGLYHSLIDWHHPEFPIDRYHPQRNHPKGDRPRDIGKYREYLHEQVRELLTNYGQIDYLFFDFSYEPDGELEGKGSDDWDSSRLLAMVRQLQPTILVNDRLGIPGDVVTPEQYQPQSAPTRGGIPVRWEACQTLNGSWGYDRDNLDFKSVDVIIRTLVDTVSKGGNLLLNVGPNARGSLDSHSAAILSGLGEWMGLHREAIYGCGPSTFSPPNDCRYTQNGARLFLHIFAWPLTHVHLAGLAGRVRFARFLHDGSEVKQLVIPADQVAQNTTLPGMPADTLTLVLPTRNPDGAVPVIELTLK